MYRLRRYGTLIVAMMLAVLSWAYAGKALHTHDDSYYGISMSDDGEGRTDRSNLSDICPICHFHFQLCTAPQSATVLFCCTVLVATVAESVFGCVSAPAVDSDPRGPPFHAAD